MADHLAQEPLLSSADTTEPVDPHALASRLWTDILGAAPASHASDFFDEGGDSLGAVRLIGRLREALGSPLPVRSFLSNPTFGGLCTLLSSAIDAPAPYDPVIPLQQEGSSPPVFCVHAAAGTATRFVPLIRAMEPRRVAHGLQSRGADAESPERYRSFEEMVSHYTTAVVHVARPPYVLLGYSLGGLIAFEIAHRLAAADHEVAFLGLLDSPSRVTGAVPLAERLSWFVEHGLQIDMDVAALAELPPEDRAQSIRDRALACGVIDESVSWRRIASMADTYEHNVELVAGYVPDRLDVPATLFRASTPDGESLDLGWPAHLPNLVVESVPGDHFSMMRPPHADVLGAAVDAAIAEALAGEPSASERRSSS